MSLVGIVSNAGKDVVGLPWDLQCDAPDLQITVLPAVPFCLIAAWASTVAHGVFCPLQVYPHPVWDLAPWKSLLASEIGSCAGACSWIKRGLSCFRKVAVVSELLGCSQKFGDVAVLSACWGAVLPGQACASMDKWLSRLAVLSWCDKEGGSWETKRQRDDLKWRLQNVNKWVIT